MNLSIVIGNLGSDAEVVESNGQRFVTLSVADSRKFKKQDGTEVNQTNWVDAIISDPSHPVIPFLKQGVKVAIIGQTSLRVYSSKKDRMMKAGQTIRVLNIELCGGSSDEVPRELIDPDSGRIVSVRKLYWVPEYADFSGRASNTTLVDKKGHAFIMDKIGFIKPLGDTSANGEDAAQGSAAGTTAAAADGGSADDEDRSDIAHGADEEQSDDAAGSADSQVNEDKPPF